MRVPAYGRNGQACLYQQGQAAPRGIVFSAKGLRLSASSGGPLGSVVEVCCTGVLPLPLPSSVVRWLQTKFSLLAVSSVRLQPSLSGLDYLSPVKPRFSLCGSQASRQSESIGDPDSEKGGTTPEYVQLSLFPCASAVDALGGDACHSWENEGGAVRD